MGFNNSTKPNSDKYIFQINQYMDGNPENYKTMSIEDQKFVADCIGSKYFSEIESFDEAVDFFRETLDKRNLNAMFLIEKMQYYFQKAFYQSQIPYTEIALKSLYREIFDEKIIVECLNSYDDTNDIFWDWTVNSLKKLNYIM